MAKVIIEIDKDYFEILKYEVRNGNDFLPIKIIANGTPLEKEGYITTIERRKENMPCYPFD